jgi:hypothetical protein
MTLELIPFPISILFVVVFGLACMAVLWKLRERGKIYSILFKASLIIGILLLVALLFSIITGMLG